MLRHSGKSFVPEKGVDISYGGLSLATGQLLEPGSDWHLVVSMEDGRLEVPVKARVRHVRALREEPPFMVGLKLLQLDAGLAREYARVVRGLFGVPESRRAHRRIQIHTEAIWRRRTARRRRSTSPTSACLARWWKAPERPPTARAARSA